MINFFFNLLIENKISLPDTDFFIQLNFFLLQKSIYLLYFFFSHRNIVKI